MIGACLVYYGAVGPGSSSSYFMATVDSVGIIEGTMRVS